MKYTFKTKSELVLHVADGQTREFEIVYDKGVEK